MPKLKIRRRGPWSLFLTLAIALLASGQDTSPQHPVPGSTSIAKIQGTTVTPGGSVVFIDPITGAIREPDPEELQALASVSTSITAQQISNAPLQMMTHPSGAEGVVLGEDQMAYSVATIGPDGKLTMECVTGKKNAEAELETASRKEAANDR